MRTPLGENEKKRDSPRMQHSAASYRLETKAPPHHASCIFRRMLQVKAMLLFFCLGCAPSQKKGVSQFPCIAPFVQDNYCQSETSQPSTFIPLSERVAGFKTLLNLLDARRVRQSNALFVVR
jgi:hypothetical protein